METEVGDGWSGRAAFAPTLFSDWDPFDSIVVAVITIATIFVHPVHFMLRHSFWLDEAWVAALTRAPLRQLPRLSSSAPVGFVELLRLVPGSGLQRGRLVVVGFSALTTAAAYVLTRALVWNQRRVARFAAVVAALAVMLAPFSLVRNDLKQYTCDAFCALVLLALGAWVDRTTTRKSLIWLVVASGLTAPFSSTALFVTVAVFGGLLASALIARKRRRVIEIVVAGALAGALLAVYVVVMVAPNLNSKLRDYWSSFYLSGSPQHMLHVSWSHLSLLSRFLAMPAAVFVALFALGVVVLVRVQARALAVAMPLLWVEMALMGRLERYPFLDQRTSNFLLVSSFVVVAIGAVGLLGVVRRLPFVGHSRIGLAESAIVGVALAVLYTLGFAGYLEQLHLPAENVRAETYAVADHMRPHDVILVNTAANFGFSYYWPHGHIRFVRDGSGQGFRTEVDGLNAIYIPARTYADLLASLRSAVDRWQQAGPDSRLYIVRTHLSPAEEAQWQRAFAAVGYQPRLEKVGTDPLLVLGPPDSPDS